MPLYDYECPHGHRFEHVCPMADRDKPIPCEGSVNRLLNDEELEDLPAQAKWVSIDQKGSNGKTIEKVAVVPVPCILKAQRIEIAFSDTNAILQCGVASNRDAAREGRYDPLNPNTRFIKKGRTWQKSKKKP